MQRSIGAAGRRVMAALEAGGRLARDGAQWRIGDLAVEDGVVDRLVREDLARVAGDDVVLAPAGRGFTRRRAEPAMAGRVPAERPLPGDATGRRRVTVNLAESPLGWLRSRGLVDPRQFEAGERLRADWTVAQLGPRVTMRWDTGAASTGGGLNPTLAQVAAKRRTHDALDAVGAGLKDVLWRVVCDGQGMEPAEKALGWPARAGRVVLGLALDRLADHYRLG